MSNITCEQCGAAIIEDVNGNYITACEHYPFERPCTQCGLHNGKHKMDCKAWKEKFKKELKDE